MRSRTGRRSTCFRGFERKPNRSEMSEFGLSRGLFFASAGRGVTDQNGSQGSQGSFRLLLRQHPSAGPRSTNGAQYLGLPRQRAYGRQSHALPIEDKLAADAPIRHGKNTSWPFGRAVGGRGHGQTHRPDCRTLASCTANRVTLRVDRNLRSVGRVVPPRTEVDSGQCTRNVEQRTRPVKNSSFSQTRCSGSDRGGGVLQPGRLIPAQQRRAVHLSARTADSPAG